ncbi:MAG: hypothetical protein IT379_10175 [Deltaproteobacteria bacterium]|nr:hypothetical protein [Deltaproteobacteria bacterium]
MKRPERKSELALARATREAIAIVRQGALMLRPPSFARPSPHALHAEATVLIHGFMANARVFDPLRRFLELQGHGRPYAFSYMPVGTVDELSAKFARWLDANVPRTARLRIVGHSLGGIVARVFIQELGGAPRVDSLTTVATPHAGTASARLAIGRLAADMRPDSPLVERLRRGWSPTLVAHATAIVAGADVMVTPPDSAAALPGAKVVWLHGVGHNEALFHSDAHLAVDTALRRRNR